ncbi:MAG: hypothetical protein F4Y02_15530 [Chloroflexi bacterium]|nr:hypothetical protein [Chloroflexota bacterium]
MPSDSMKPIFDDFAELLDSRLQGDIPTTEDSVRYTLFASMLHHRMRPDSVVLECPHPAMPGAQLDTRVFGYCEHDVAIEFKYDRRPPGGKNSNRTQKAGSVFRDLFRLQRANKETGDTCYFIYLTDMEMHGYFNNPENRHQELYALAPHADLLINTSYFSNRPKSFMDELDDPFEAVITNRSKRTLSGGHHLRIYGVRAPDLDSRLSASG